MKFASGKPGVMTFLVVGLISTCVPVQGSLATTLTIAMRELAARTNQSYAGL